MKALKLNFLANGELEILQSAVEGARLTVQNALVNLLSEKDGDPLFPDRGTGILAEAVSGYISTQRGAQHTANFAANDMLFFSRLHDRAVAGEGLRSVVLIANIIGGNILDLETTFEIESGEVLSFPLVSTASITA